MAVLVLRIAFSLLVVLLLMWGLARVARRPLTGRRGAALTVLARQPLSRNSSVTVLQVVDRALVLGVTDHQVTLLGEADLGELERLQNEQPSTRRSPVRLDPWRMQRSTMEPSTGQRSTGQRQEPAAGALAGSALSPRTWARTLDFLRDRTARRGSPS
jgi:flagellar protein FliO/FliZ